MGGKRETVKPYYSPYYKQVETFSKNASMDISPFLQQIQNWGEKQIGKTQEFVQSLQNRALEGLKFALSNAVGQASITPYESIYSQKASEMLQKRAEPIQNVTQDIMSQYQQTASNLGGALKLAGAYTVLPTPEETGLSKARGQYQELLPSYQKAYKTSINFMKQTVDLLKQLDFTDDEIKTALNPFIKQFQIGALDVGQRFGFLKSPLETTTEKWLKEIGL
ncbi:MAG: hypothetical protein QXV73_04075 [Candidatus Micrarchaeia archaeon]